MAGELQNSLKTVADKVAQYIGDAATLKVETRALTVGADGQTQFEQATAVARSIIRLDGDSETILPMRASSKPDQLEVDTTLFEMHQHSVNTAIDYRTRILSALLNALKGSDA